MREQIELLMLDTIKKHGSIMPLFTAGYSYSKVMEWGKQLERAGEFSYKEFDEAIGRDCREKEIRYTRYADDMTFSRDFDELEVIRHIRKKLKSMGLQLNKKKTRVRKQGQQQEVTGIVVNYKTQLPKKVRKEIRKNMYYIQKYGLESHLNHIGLERKNYLEHLLGQVGYAVFINPKDQEMKRYKQILREYKQFYI